MEEKVKHHLKVLAGLALLFVGVNVLAAPKAPVKDWNFLVFINGVNNLDEFGTLNINQMEEIGSNDRLNILVQWGSWARPSVDRLLVQKDSDVVKVTSPVVQSLGRVDMGDYRNLVDFVRWSQENYPSRKTFVAVWNHGSGWHRPELIDVGLKDISHDDRTGNAITTEQLGVAMQEIAAAIGRKVDIYGSDACLMGMVEVADQMADSVKIFVGSQDLEPGEGWPYSTFLRAWTANMDMGAADVARTLTHEFLLAYDGGLYGEERVTLSAYDLEEIGSYREALHALSAKLSAQSPTVLSQLKSKISATKFFYLGDYRDVIDFSIQSGLGKIAPAETAALNAAHSRFVVANAQNQDEMTFGVSIWMPHNPQDFVDFWDRYSRLSFHRHTGWGEFLRRMHGL